MRAILDLPEHDLAICLAHALAQILGRGWPLIHDRSAPWHKAVGGCVLATPRHLSKCQREAGTDDQSFTFPSLPPC
jgi:hypothetical protein